MLATAEQLRAALRAMGRPELAEGLDVAAADELLQSAGDLVTGYLFPSEVATPTPGPISRVVAEMAAAFLTRPTAILPETQSLSADGFGVTFTPGGTSPGPYLTAALKARLRPYRSGMSSVSMGSERY
ncbi:head-to-tail adaptor [Mycobacterium phage LeMond]|uniref:Head-to-tail adaptor n=1 Tax=Mycobacterium phage KiSi TaxID=2507856 RepID=A0A410TBM1_9CAUD|nr:head-to-tail adaptor [Mycobacterium phage KiSi]AYR01078.1 head-to-tail adaptor [Mycobacterium phage LeMond]AYR01180.1 head-to-tail adaptor [Mycobacterium phage Oscar]AYR01613.1 head-to-tail adaptor [Mycobacterium phage Scarlett]QAU06431.1 head-to-tail adaptor [Mycobacterium phage KiSi]